MKVFQTLGSLILFVLLLTSCKAKKTPLTPSSFDTLMGADLPQWKYVQTKDDYDNLHFFKSLYEAKIELLSHPCPTWRVPKVIHFIWLGPKPFPLESFENIRSWVKHHPGWSILFWTDRLRDIPIKEIRICRVQDFSFLQLYPCYQRSNNYAEKSDVLRYEILYQQGGIYVDHDVKCLKSFDAFCQSFDFYCGLEIPSPTCLSSPIVPTNNLIGSIPHHPILKECMDWLKIHWDSIERDYPGSDTDAVISRVAHRTFAALGEAFHKAANQEGTLDIAFPAFYFNAPQESQALYAQHLYKGSWFENETAFEKSLRQSLIQLSKALNRNLMLFGILLFVTTVTGAVFFRNFIKCNQ